MIRQRHVHAVFGVHSTARCWSIAYQGSVFANQTSLWFIKWSALSGMYSAVQNNHSLTEKVPQAEIERPDGDSTQRASQCKQLTYQALFVSTKRQRMWQGNHHSSKPIYKWLEATVVSCTKRANYFVVRYRPYWNKISSFNFAECNLARKIITHVHLSHTLSERAVVVNLSAIYSIQKAFATFY